MKLPRYPKYKNSGVEWLGEVPEHWTIRPLRYLIDRLESGTSVNAVDDPAADGEIGVLKTSCVYSGSFDPTENKTVVANEVSRVSCPLRAGTLIVSRMNTPELVGATGLVKVAPKNLFLPDRLWQVSFNDAVPAYIYYWSQSVLYRAHIRSVCSGTSSSMQNLGQDQYRAFVLATPPVPEQQAIALFVDKEIWKIDALVKEQRRLIELLKEKRQAVISHAVTKGLNPDAPMKDSGIEWLGEVPEHWDVKRIKYAIRKLEQGWSPQCENFPAEDGEWAVLKVGCVNGGNFNPGENKALPPELTPIPELGICVGDVLISRANTRELAGSTAVAESDYPRLLLCDKLYRLRLHAEVCLPEYLAMFLSTPSARGEIELSATGASSSMVNIGQSTITEMLMPLPPVREQERIAAFVNDETGKTDQLIAAATHAIDLLQERRTALISAAVTGKIDVRGLSGTEAA